MTRRCYSLNTVPSIILYFMFYLSPFELIGFGSQSLPHVHSLCSGSGVRSEVTCGPSSATVWGSCGASATTTQPGSTRVATGAASSRDWPAARTTFTHRQTSRVSTSTRTRGGTLWPATPTGDCAEPSVYQAEGFIFPETKCCSEDFKNLHKLNHWHRCKTELVVAAWL